MKHVGGDELIATYLKCWEPLVCMFNKTKEKNVTTNRRAAFESEEQCQELMSKTRHGLLQGPSLR